MNLGWKDRLLPAGRYAAGVLLVVSWLLALGLAGLGAANRRSVEAVATEALEGRALDLALSRRWSLLVLRPAGPEELQTDLEELADERIRLLALVAGNGRVVAASARTLRGQDWSARIPSMGTSGHHVERLGFGVYEIWLRVPRGGRRWQRWRRMWRRMHEMMWRCMEEGRCRHGPSWGPGPPGGPMNGPDPAPGPGTPGPGGRWGSGPGPGRPPGPAGPGPYLAMRVVLDAPVIRRALQRAGSIQLLSLLVALALLVVSTLVFLAQRRARRLEAKVADQERLAELGRMAAVLAHEIRTPLGVMKGRAQLAAERVPDQARGLGVIVEQAARLERLVNDLLLYARPLEPRAGLVDLSSLVRECLELLAEEAHERGVLLVSDLEEVSACVDRDQFQQVILNVLRNALDVSEDTVTVTLRRQGADAILQVADTGPGIPAEDLAKIFAPFYTKKARGTGLGLAVARRIVEAHGGSIRAENLPNRGARFEIRVPAAC